MNSNLTDTLNRILRWVEQHKPCYVEYLQPGLSMTEIKEMVGNLPIQLSPEICELYQWRNGAKEGDLGQETAWIFKNWTFKPLQEILAQYRQYLSQIKLRETYQINTITYFNYYLLQKF